MTGMLLVLVTGVFWGTWFALCRTMYSFPPKIFSEIGKRIIDNVAVGMSIMMPLSIIGLLILLFTSWQTRMNHFYWVFATLAVFIVVLIITVVIEVPIDNQIKTWTAAAIPPDWKAVRDRWEFFHTIRTFLSLLGMAFFIMAIIKRLS